MRIVVAHEPSLFIMVSDDGYNTFMATEMSQLMSNTSFATVDLVMRPPCQSTGTLDKELDGAMVTTLIREYTGRRGLPVVHHQSKCILKQELVGGAILNRA